MTIFLFSFFKFFVPSFLKAESCQTLWCGTCRVKKGQEIVPKLIVSFCAHLRDELFYPSSIIYLKNSNVCSRFSWLMGSGGTATRVHGDLFVVFTESAANTLNPLAYSGYESDRILLFFPPTLRFLILRLSLVVSFSFFAGCFTFFFLRKLLDTLPDERFRTPRFIQFLLKCRV